VRLAAGVPARATAEAALRADIAFSPHRLELEAGIYVVGFSCPVDPKDKARIRAQISAAHEADHLERAVAAFVAVA
jgi:glycine C-acetyltransferase